MPNAINGAAWLQPGRHVHLAIPAKKAGEANFQANGSTANGNIRFLQEGAMVKDETTRDRTPEKAQKSIRSFWDAYKGIRLLEMP